MPKLSCFALMYSREIVADSFITFPRFPVMVRFPFPLLKMLSMNKMSPPTEVQAKPVTTPGTSIISDEFLDIGTPRISSIFCSSILGSYSFSIVICNATQREILAICFSKFLTPLSLVKASITCAISLFPSLYASFWRPVSSICFLMRCLLAISTFSSMV